MSSTSSVHRLSLPRSALDGAGRRRRRQHRVSWSDQQSGGVGTGPNLSPPDGFLRERSASLMSHGALDYAGSAASSIASSAYFTPAGQHEAMMRVVSREIRRRDLLYELVDESVGAVRHFHARIGRPAFTALATSVLIRDSNRRTSLSAAQVCGGVAATMAMAHSFIIIIGTALPPLRDDDCAWSPPSSWLSPARPSSAAFIRIRRSRGGRESRGGVGADLAPSSVAPPASDIA
ncbi:hypothetical protein MTO96_023634 [Rhipicephalus appendiculatus]